MAELKRRQPGLVVEELHVVTSGDRIQNRPLNDIGGKGLFVKEIEEAMLEGRADIAVHSLKDVPPELMSGLEISCIPQRADPRDVLVTRTSTKLAQLAQGSRVGTSSLRRKVQLLRLRPDLEIVPLRGNVDTRLRKCREGEVDAIVLARAGLLRLGIAEQANEVLGTEQLLPAVGQGALGVEQRAGDSEVSELLAVLHDTETATAVAAERGVMAAVDGNCQTPVAAFAQRLGEALWLRALLAEPDGSHYRADEVRVPFPSSPAQSHELGLRLGQRLRQP